MEKVREDFDHIKAALDEMLYYNPEELERQADEYEREIARKEGREEGRKEGRKEGREEGIKEGIKEGRELGLKEGNAKTLEEIVINMYNANFTTDDIIKITKLTVFEVDNILNANK